MSNLPAKYILYGEDDHDDQLLVREMMSDIDPSIELICVDNGLAVLQFLEALKPGDVYPCCVILDINMPLLDGIRVLRIMMQQTGYKELPVVMFSTSNASRDKELSLQCGAREFITKPVAFEQVEQVCRKFAAYCHAVPHPQRA